jgi:hypothetical protein
MQVILETFVQQTHAETSAWDEVKLLASSLLDALNAPRTLARIHEANNPGTSSAEVQAAFQPSAEALGFESERQGLFADSIVGLRPDYYRRVGATGIHMEVERGKTTTNNMDLLDFWKCHLCSEAAYLFLLVPQQTSAQSRHDAQAGVREGQPAPEHVL